MFLLLGVRLLFAQLVEQASATILTVALMALKLLTDSDVIIVAHFPASGPNATRGSSCEAPSHWKCHSVVPLLLAVVYRYWPPVVRLHCSYA